MYCGGEDTAENSKIEDKAGKEDTNEKEKCFGDSVVNSIDSEHSDTCDCKWQQKSQFYRQVRKNCRQSLMSVQK